jgi:nucleotide-binding universal stress UspA family protein
LKLPPEGSELLIANGTLGYISKLICAALILPSRKMHFMPKNKILIPLNQSELSQEILPHVEKYISAKENDLILFYLTKPPKGAGFGTAVPAGHILKPGIEPVGPAPHPIFASQQEDSIRAHVEAELLPVTNRFKQLGYATSILIDFGKDPVDEILRVINTNGIDLIAMSSRARIGVTRFFFRDIADALAQKARIPVLLIHPSGSSKEQSH